MWRLRCDASGPSRKRVSVLGFHVQRAFSAFPSGAPGVSLIAFRACVAAQLLTHLPQLLAHAPWAGWVAALLALALATGLLTPVAALVSVPARYLAVVNTGGGLDEAVLFECAFALILALLGPGAYSVDARLYGRRLIKVPDTDTPPSDADRDESDA